MVDISLVNGIIKQLLTGGTLRNYVEMVDDDCDMTGLFVHINWDFHHPN